jgi:3-oxoacyl-[acyl-carrier protein] reductase
MSSRQDPLAGQVALVTGGSRRIGREICLRLARDGAAVAVNARASLSEAEQVVQDIEKVGGRAMIALADISDEAANKALIESIIQRYGRLDIVVHNAVNREHGSFESLDLAAFRAAQAVVVDGAFLLAKHAAPELVKTKGSFVFISGATAFTGAKGPGTPTAKSALVGLMRSIAVTYGALGVRANLISPGRIEAEEDAEERKAELSRGRPDHLIPLRRPGRPQEIANVVAAVAGPDFSYVTGQVIHATGGFFMGS